MGIEEVFEETILLAYGMNYWGQLGISLSERIREPGGFRSYFDDQPLEVTHNFFNQFVRVNLPEGFKLEDVISGSNHSFIQGKKSGQTVVYSTGCNDYGQLGLGLPTKGARNRQKAFHRVEIENVEIEKVICGVDSSFVIGKFNSICSSKLSKASPQSKVVISYDGLIVRPPP